MVPAEEVVGALRRRVAVLEARLEKALTATAEGGSSVDISAGNLPAASFDLRNYGPVPGRNYAGSVRNQHLPMGSRCASCWAVTSASVMGARLNMMLEKAGVALRSTP